MILRFPITPESLAAAGNEGWSLVPVSDIWEAELLPLLRRYRSVRRPWQQAVTDIVEDTSATARFDPFKEPAFYALTSPAARREHLRLSMEATDTLRHYDAVRCILDGPDLLPRTKADLIRLAFRMLRDHTMTPKQPRWWVVPQCCHQMINAAHALATAWAPTTMWEVYHGASYGRQHSALFDLRQRRIFDIMNLNDMEDKQTARDIYEFCLAVEQPEPVVAVPAGMPSNVTDFSPRTMGA
jgi:hypothetical protein